MSKIHEKAIFIKAGNPRKKLVGVKFSGLKPISTFHFGKRKMKENSRKIISLPFLCNSTKRKFIYFIVTLLIRLIPFVSFSAYIKSVLRCELRAEGKRYKIYSAFRL